MSWASWVEGEAGFYGKGEGRGSVLLGEVWLLIFTWILFCRQRVKLWKVRRLTRNGGRMGRE